MVAENEEPVSHPAHVIRAAVGILAIVAGSVFTTATPSFAASGDVDHGYSAGLGTGFDGYIAGVAATPDGGTIVTGQFTTADGIPAANIAKISQAGAVDTTFATNVGLGLSEAGAAVAVQPNGAVVVAGTFTQADAHQSNHLSRFDATGHLDAVFAANVAAPANEITDPVDAIAIQPNGKILIAGDFGSIGPSLAHSYIARFNADGTLDTSFVGDLDRPATSLALEPDGSILVGGFFTSADGVPTSRLAHLSSTGAVDTAFSAHLGTGFDHEIWGVGIQSTGRIVVVGDFTQLNGVAESRLAFVGPTGVPVAVDPAQAGADALVNSVIVRADDSVLIAGAFTTVGGAASRGVARLDSDLVFDGVFTTAMGTGLDGNAIAMAADATGGLVIGGQFGSIDGSSSARLARVFLSPATAPGCVAGAVGVGCTGSTPSGPHLAATGASVEPGIALGGALIVAGLGLVTVRGIRRGRSGRHRA